jgi:hypothetical protein
MDDFKLEVLGYVGLAGFLVWVGEKIMADAIKMVRQWKRLQRELKKHP